MKDNIYTLHQTKAALSFMSGNAENAYCKECKYIRMCHGGCKRQNVCYLKDDYCGYREVLDYCLDKLVYLLRRYK